MARMLQRQTRGFLAGNRGLALAGTPAALNLTRAVGPRFAATTYHTLTAGFLTSGQHTLGGDLADALRSLVQMVHALSI